MDGTAHAIGSTDVTTLGRVVGIYAAVCFAAAVTLIVSGLGLIGTSIWLAMSGSPLRNWLATRTVPGPTR